jgi:predicted outer membrane lipoprotein
MLYKRNAKTFKSSTFSSIFSSRSACLHFLRQSEHPLGKGQPGLADGVSISCAFLLFIIAAILMEIIDSMERKDKERSELKKG